MPIPLPATGVGLVVTGAVNDNSVEFTAISDAYIGTETKPGVNTEMALAVSAMATTAVTAKAFADSLVLAAASLSVVSTQIGLSNKLGSVGVKSSDANFNYNANANVITARNLLTGPDDKITMPPAPPGLL